MNKSNIHKRVVAMEIIAIIAAIVVFACAITLIVQYNTDLVGSSYASYISGWFNSLQFKSGYDTTVVLLSSITSLCGFVFGLLSLIFGIKARRYVGIWYFFQMDFVGGACGLGLSLAAPLLAITKLNAEFKYYGLLLFAFIFGVISLVFLLLQFISFLCECKEIKNSHVSNLEVSTNEENNLDDKSSSNANNNESLVASATTEEKPVVTSEDNVVTVKDSTEEEKVEVKVNPTTKKENNVTKKSSQTSNDKSKKTTTSSTDENTKKVDNKVTNDKTPIKSSGKVYHISQHPSTNKWQVKLAKGEKALKLFDTQAEAINYAKEIAANQGGSIRVHSREGKIRKA